MDANEESEIAESLGRVMRTAMAGSMQQVETSARRDQLREAERLRVAQEADRTQQLSTAQEKNVASTIRQDTFSREFWRTAGSEQIADYATVSAHLAGRHPEARSAYMHISDVLRNDYGINIEQINKDHPMSLTDRHHALREALDDHFARQRLDGEADAAMSKATAERAQEAEAGAPESASAELLEAEAQQKRAEADKAGQDESQSLADADRYGAEHNKDQAHARSEEITGGRDGKGYQRASDADLKRLGQHDQQAADVRGRTRQNFPEGTRQRVFARNRPAARRGNTATRQPARQVEVSR